MKRYPSFIAAGLMLTALTTPQTRAAENTWNNGSANFLWDLTSANWTSPTIWAEGADAVFGATGAGQVTLASPITVQHQTFNTAGYTIAGAGNPLTLAGAAPTITVNADATNTASLYGTNGLTIQGTGVLTLEGDTGAPDGNHYTGGTYVKSGTLVLASGGVQDGLSYAVDSIVGLDAGAKVVLPAVWNGGDASLAYPQGQIGYMVPGSKFVMTGGTLDYYNDPKSQRIPAPEGTGLIVNTGPNTQAGVQAYIGSANVAFSGVIADGNGGVLATNNNYLSGPGYQIGIVQLYALNGGGGTWILSGSNTYSGSTRIQAGPNSGIKLEGNGTIGFPSSIGLTGPMRLYDGFFDLNGHNQTMALMQSGNAAARIFNSATGTVSTLTIGYGNELANRTCSYQLMDNEGTGGIFALKKIITAPYLHWTDVEVISCNQTLTGVCTYSGDTTVEGGSLILAAPESVSPNSAYRLSTNNYALLALTYSGDAPVRQLWINGVQQPNGTYGVGTPGIDPASTGTITVNGSTLPNTWNNGSANFLWDLTSANWTSPTIWAEGADAAFGATGAGPVTLGGPITVQHQTFNAAGYTIVGAGNLLTLAGSAPTITVNADTTNNVSLAGTNGLTIEGTGSLTLAGDAGASDGNHYTGGTHVKGGTVILAAPGATSDGLSYAVDSIEALDAGATVKFATPFDGTTYTSYRDQIGVNATEFTSRLHLTGGTFDLNDDPKSQRIPVPEGAGLIINTGTNVQSGLIMVADGMNHDFSGVIADGGPLVGDNVAGGPTPQGPGRQIGIVSFAGAKNGGGGLWTLSGSNTYSGSTRIDQGASIKLVGNGTIGFPTASGSLTGPMRMYGSATDPTRGYFDLNGHNQTIALMQNGNTDAKIFNSAVGTVSTLTIGYGNEQVVRNCPYQLIDNQGAGGIFALKKVATGPAYIIPGTSTPATNCTQTLGGVNTYSGDTTVEGGHLIMTATTAVSSNSAFRLFTVAQGQCPDSSVSLALNYEGTADVRQLWIDGVQQPNGVYGASTPGINPNSIGTLTVTGSVAGPTLGATQTGNTLNFSWEGVYKLQVSVNSVSGPWTDVTGAGLNSASVPIDPANVSAFYRLVTY